MSLFCAVSIRTISSAVSVLLSAGARRHLSRTDIDRFVFPLAGLLSVFVALGAEAWS